MEQRYRVQWTTQGGPMHSDEIAVLAEAEARAAHMRSIGYSDARVRDLAAEAAEAEAARIWLAERAAERAAAEAARLAEQETVWPLVGPTVELALPPRFYEDHVSRDLHPGRVVRRTKSSVVVRLDAAAYADLLSDARYYSDAAEWGSEYLGLASSARATVKRLLKAGAPGA